MNKQIGNTILIEKYGWNEILEQLLKFDPIGLMILLNEEQMDVKLLIYIYYKFIYIINSLSICEAFIVGEMNFKKVA